MADLPLIAVLFCFGLACLETVARTARPFRSFGFETSVTPAVYAGLTLFIAVEFYVFVLPPFRPYPYADDWIYALPLKFSSASEWVTWAFAQHVDHRIPIQKLTNFLILRAAGFDFRYMVGVNYLIAVGTTAMLLSVARAYRGFLTAGDLLIPLAILNFGVGYTQWGFLFEFLSSVFFITIFVLLGFRYAGTGRAAYMVGAAVALIACSLTGLNGLIPATCITAAMLGWFGFQVYRGPSKVPGFAVALLIVALVIDLIIWKSWTPTQASNLGGISVAEFVRYMYSLVPSSMVVFSFQHISWKFLTVSLLFIAAMAICSYRLIKRTLTLEDFLLGLGAMSSLIIITSIAIGRSKAQGEWNAVLGMHYGLLSIFIPALSWIIVSKWLPRWATAALGISLAGIFLVSFWANMDWRLGVVSSVRAHQAVIEKTMRSGEDVETLAEKYLMDFTIDEPHKRDVTEGIAAFRADGAKLYGASH